MVRLLACPSCARHVRAGEAACPFCGHELEGVAPRVLAPLPTTRAAALFVGATALAGCGKEPAPPPPPDPHQLAAPAYGLPPQDLQPQPQPEPPRPEVAPDAGKDAGKK